MASNLMAIALRVGAIVLRLEAMGLKVGAIFIRWELTYRLRFQFAHGAAHRLWSLKRRLRRRGQQRLAAITRGVLQT